MREKRARSLAFVGLLLAAVPAFGERFQLVAAEQLVYRLDTTTGRTWVATFSPRAEGGNDIIWHEVLESGKNAIKPTKDTQAPAMGAKQ